MGEIVRPSAFAVLRFTVRLNLRGGSIGTAAGNQNFQNNGVDLGGGTHTIDYEGDTIVGTFFTDSNNATADNQSAQNAPPNALA